MIRTTLQFCLPCVCMAIATLHGVADEYWPLDTLSAPLLSAGRVDVVSGIGQSKALAFRGDGVVTVSDSAGLSAGHQGFTLTVQVNPWLLNAGQQMIVGKHRYSLNQRQWGLMIDQDNMLRLYVWQGHWVTVSSDCILQPGQWYQVGITVRPEVAELWLNGELQNSVPLKSLSIPTDAPITFGGIDDNGNRRQHLFGILDNARLYPSPLSSEQMASVSPVVNQTQPIPDDIIAMAALKDPQQLFELRDPSFDLPKSSALDLLPDVQFSVIKAWTPQQDGFHWLHGVALAWHHDRLFASFGHNVGAENTLTEQGRYCVSDDQGQTWSGIRTIDEGTEADDLAVSHGVFLSHGDTLWAFLGAFHGTRQQVHTRAYTLNEATSEWIPHGIVAEGGFWPMTEPVRMRNGNWIMGGLIVGHGNPAAVAISDGDQLTKWSVREIPAAKGVGSMWGESCIMVDGSRIVNVARYGKDPIALAAVSEDDGQTWTPSRPSNLPMATSKPYAGTLSTGQHYLVCTTTADSGGRRFPLTIAVSRPGESLFSRVFVIRYAEFPDGPGESNPRASLAYPYAVEHDGHLYVGYSNSGGRGGNQNSAELAVIPITQLQVPAE
ncbi:MAG: exo-alpha-sialidase [Planctomycetaceae bacterium]|nr:exo-alpha-sialidase [Planctomycetaceae bacterium]